MKKALATASSWVPNNIANPVTPLHLGMPETAARNQGAPSHLTNTLLPILLLSSPLFVRGVYHIKWK